MNFSLKNFFFVWKISSPLARQWKAMVNLFIVRYMIIVFILLLKKKDASENI